MYCKVCGQYGPGNRKDCIYCGSPFDLSEKDYKLPEEKQQDETYHPIRSKKERSINFRRLFLSLCYVSAAILAILLLFPSFRCFVVRNFTPPSMLLEVAYRDGIEHIVSYAKKVETQSAGDSMAAQYHIDIQNSEIMLSLLSKASQIKQEDISGLSDIQIDCDVAIDSNLLSGLYNVKLCDKSTISIEQYVDANQMQQWIKIPELSPQYLFVNMDDARTSDDAINEDSASLLQIDPEVLQVLSVHYTKMMIDGFENINRFRETVCYLDISQRLTVVEASVSSNQLYHNLLSIIEDASVNPEIANLFHNVENQKGDAYYTDFLLSLNEQKSALNQLIQQSDGQSVFTLYTYLNRKNEIVGLRIEYFENGEQYHLFSCVTVNKKKSFEIEMRLWDGLLLRGRGTADEFVNGSFSLFHSDTLFCTFILEDVTYKSTEITGNVTIIPSEDIVEHLFDELGAYEAYLYSDRLPEFSLKTNLNWSSSQKQIALTFYTGEDPVSSIQIVVIPKQPHPVILPDELMDDSKYLTSELWHKEIDEESLTSFFEHMEKAGINVNLFLKDFSKEDKLQ